MDKAVELAIGLRVSDTYRILPFTKKYRLFERIDQKITLTNLSYYCSSPSFPVEVEYIFSAPFYPDDEELSAAPYFYLNANITTDNPVELTFFFKFYPERQDKVSELNVDNWLGFCITSAYQIKDVESHPLRDEEDTFSSRSFSAKWAFIAEHQHKISRNKKDDCLELSWQIHATPSEKQNVFLILAAHSGENILNVKGKPHKFKYTATFDNVKSVIKYAISKRTNADIKTLIFNTTLTEASLPRSLTQLGAFAFQNFASNVWWTVDKKGREWLSVWDGERKLHSSATSIYNISVFYLLFYPDGLAPILDRWAAICEDKGNNSLSESVYHVLGAFLKVDGCLLLNDICKIEANCNFISVLYSYWRYTGYTEQMRKHYELVKKLILFIQNSFSRNFSISTVGDAESKESILTEQTHLAIKTLAAYTFGEKMAQTMEDAQFAESCASFAKLIRQRLDRTWLIDHFALRLAKENMSEGRENWEHNDKTQQIMKNRFAPTHNNNAGATLCCGRKVYSISTFNSLLHALLTNTKINLDWEKVKLDITNSYYQNMLEYGCTTRSFEGTIQFSENMWRDMVAAYLGLDLTHNLENYWRCQLHINTQKSGGYSDLYRYNDHANEHSYNPLGVVSVGYLYALGGVQIDKVERTIRFHPLRVPLRIPLPTLADWSRGLIPWVEFQPQGNKIKTIIANDECLDGFYVVETTPRNLTQPPGFHLPF